MTGARIAPGSGGRPTGDGAPPKTAKGGSRQVASMAARRIRWLVSENSPSAARLIDAQTPAPTLFDLRGHDQRLARRRRRTAYGAVGALPFGSSVTMTRPLTPSRALWNG